MKMLRIVSRVMICLVLVLAAVQLARAQAGTSSPGAAPATTTGAPAQPAAGAPDAAAPRSLNRTSMGEAFFMVRNPVSDKIEIVGTAILWVLIGLSILCSSLIGTLFWNNRVREFFSDALLERLRSQLYEKQIEAAARTAKQHPSMLGGIVAAALAESGHGYGAVVRACEQAADELAVRKLRAIEPLNVVGNVAPMLGLFGTVYGIILSFREIVASGGTPDPVSLAAGIGAALVATFWGLVVAIPALAAYGLLRNKIDGWSVRAQHSAEELISQLRPASSAPRPASGGPAA